MTRPSPATIESPCTGICTIDQPSGLCLGCGRNLEQIAGWSSYAPGTRRAIMAGLKKPSVDEGNRA
ncbi:DUF1289 domain-containing protein [Rhizobium sp.]|jgi:uncharacterized protein|uniref:DUF1289 domain-containing protein n=1 Tax=Rhizobium sp. TaxID=391 RepID=UPI000E92A362|nr:DUF1289 domain-containing protein [Rhizobium sp.]